jgi:hypothetical protein
MTRNLTSELCSYTIQQIEKGFALMDDFSNPIKTHLGSNYPPLPLETAKVLAEDIFEIINDKFYIGEERKRISLQPNEVLIHPDRFKIRKEQERMSFCICVENTFIEIKNKKDFELPLQHLIQWDGLYRMSPNPNAKMDQITACEQAIAYLGADWKDLPANYCQTLEEMEAEEVDFVAEGLVNRLVKIFNELTLAEKVAVWFLYEFFQRYSITISLLWVKGLVDGACMEDGFYTLASGFSQKEIKKMRKKEGNFIQRRLLFLKDYLNTKEG